MRLAMPFIESPMSIVRVVRAELIPPSVLIVAQNTHSLLLLYRYPAVLLLLEGARSAIRANQHAAGSI